MLRTCAFKIVEQLIKHNAIDEDRSPIYVYGAELTLSTLAGCFSILLISFIMQNILSGLVFLIIFINLRLFTGGYHAQTYCGCFFVSNFAFLCSFGISRIMERSGNFIITLVVLIAAAAIAFTLTPIQNPHHPLSQKAYIKNKKTSRVLILGEVLAVTLLYALTKNFPIFSVASASFAAVAAMMIIPKIQERRT